MIPKFSRFKVKPGTFGTSKITRYTVVITSTSPLPSNDNHPSLVLIGHEISPSLDVVL